MTSVVSVLGYVLTVPNTLVITVAIYSGCVPYYDPFIGRRLVQGITGKTRPRRSSGRSRRTCASGRHRHGLLSDG